MLHCARTVSDRQKRLALQIPEQPAKVADLSLRMGTSASSLSVEELKRFDLTF